MQAADRTEDHLYYYKFLDAPAELLSLELSSRAARLRTVVLELQYAEPRRSTRSIMVEFSVLLVFAVGSIIVALIPLWTDAAGFVGQTDQPSGFPSALSGLALIIAPVSLYGLYSGYRSYRVSHQRRIVVSQFVEHAARLINEAEEISSHIASHSERGSR